VVSWPAWPSARHSVQRRTRLPKRGSGLSKARAVGSQYGYRPNTFKPESPIWPFVRAYGLDSTAEGGGAGLIYVNMLGQRFFQEDTRSYDFLAAAMGSAILDADTPDAKRVGGPIWAIFDADQVERHGMGMLRDLPMSTLKTASSSPGTHWRNWRLVSSTSSTRTIRCLPPTWKRQ